MTKVLVPFDGSESAMRAVRYAISMAKKSPQHEFSLLHVIDITRLGTDESFWKGDTKEKILAEGEQLLAPARQAFDQADVRYTSEVMIGVPGNDIASHAHATGCDAIVMGTRGMSALASFFIGSVAQRVVHNADVPVTLVK